MSEPVRPSFAQRIGYIAGRTLPVSMQDWVAHDLTGPGAARRYVVRFLVLIVPLLALFLLIPGPLWMGAAMMALLLIPLVYFLIALMYVYRRHRLLQHGLDPALADAAARPSAAVLDYERRHGRA